MPNVTKKNLIIIKSIIVWKWNHLSFHKKYFRKKKNKFLLYIYARRLPRHLWFDGRWKSPFAGLNWNLCETIKFKNYSKQLAVPFKIYDDFESVLKWAQSDDRGSNAFYNKKYQKHIPCNFA